MHQNPTLHTWMHHNHHFSSKCTEILPLTHECTEIVTPHVNGQESSRKWMYQNLTKHMKASKSSSIKKNVPESYPSDMNAPKSSLLRWMHRNPTPHTWMHRNHHPSGKCTRILPLTHECTKIVTPQVNAPESYLSHMNAPKSSSLR